VDSARKGDEVCVKIDAVPGEAPKLYGRHFDDTDLLISRVGHLLQAVEVDYRIMMCFSNTDLSLVR
jgi:hypothetical protein